MPKATIEVTRLDKAIFVDLYNLFFILTDWTGLKRVNSKQLGGSLI